MTGPHLGRGGIDVAYVLPNLEIGGAERSVLTLARELVHRGLRPAIVTLVGGGALVAEATTSGVAVHVLGRPTAVPDPRLVLRLRGWLAEHRPAICHAHVAEANLVARLACAGLDTVLVDSAHNVIEGGWEITVGYRVTRRLTRLHHAVSPPVADRLLRLGMARADRTIVRPNPIPLPPPDAVAPVRAEVRRLVTVGRFVPQKDQQTLVQAFAIARAERPDLRLLLVGYGPEEDRLRTCAAGLGLGDSVGFVGPVGDVGPHLRAADAFVTTSIVEGHPLAPIEAAAHGLPVVATDIAPLRAALPLADDRTFPPGDAPACAAAILRLAELPPSARRAEGRRLRDHVADHDAAGAVAAQWHHDYERLLHDGTRRRPRQASRPSGAGTAVVPVDGALGRATPRPSATSAASARP